MSDPAKCIAVIQIIALLSFATGISSNEDNCGINDMYNFIHYFYDGNWDNDLVSSYMDLLEDVGFKYDWEDTDWGAPHMYLQQMIFTE